jgi:hypothetical protein
MDASSHPAPPLPADLDDHIAPLARAWRALQTIAADAPEAVAAAADAALDDGEWGDCTLFKGRLNAW